MNVLVKRRAHTHTENMCGMLALWEWDCEICEWPVSLPEFRESLKLISKNQKVNHRYDMGVLLPS